MRGSPKPGKWDFFAVWGIFSLAASPCGCLTESSCSNTLQNSKALNLPLSFARTEFVGVCPREFRAK